MAQITAAMVKQLRDETQLPMMECKKALIESGGDKEAAKQERGGCKQNYFALRDINVGEEILLDYGDFAIAHGWEWFGL